MKKKISKYLLLIFAIATGYIVISNLPIGETSKDTFEKVVKKYYFDSFEGIISKKFIDNNHAYRKVVIENNKNFRTILLDYEKKELFSYIKKGDFVLKKKKSLSFLLSRNGFDTIIKFEFNNMRDHEKFQHVINMIEDY